MSQLLHVTAAGHGPEAVVSALGKTLRRSLAVTDAAGRLLASYSRVGSCLVWPKVLALPTLPKDMWRGALALNGEEVTVVIFSLGEEVLRGFLIIVENDRPLPAKDLSRVKQMSVALLLELGRWAATEEAEKRYRNEFIQDLVYGNFLSLEDVINRGQLWGWDFGKPYVVAVLELDGLSGVAAERKETQRFVAIAEHHLACEEGVILGERGGQAIVLVPASEALTGWAGLKARVRSMLTRLRSQMQAGLRRTFSAGIGQLYPSPLYLYRSYQEAKTALALARVFGQQGQIKSFDELGVLRLLYEVPQPELEAFYRQMLGPLEEHDREHEGLLAETLAAYLTSGASVTATAKKLFIHENTLRYRLQKIEELLTVHLDNLEDRVSLFVALTLRSLRQKC